MGLRYEFLFAAVPCFSWNRFVDPVMWGCTFALLGAAILGPQIYVTPIFGLTPTNWLEITLYTSGVLTSHPVIAWNIYKYDKVERIASSCSSAWFFSHRSYRDKTGMMRPCFEAAKPLYPLVSLFIISTTWAYLSPNFILKHDPRVFFMITGTIFSNFSVSWCALETCTSLPYS